MGLASVNKVLRIAYSDWSFTLTDRPRSKRTLRTQLKLNGQLLCPALVEEIRSLGRQSSVLILTARNAVSIKEAREANCPKLIFLINVIEKELEKQNIQLQTWYLEPVGTQCDLILECKTV